LLYYVIYIISCFRGITVFVWGGGGMQYTQ